MAILKKGNITLNGIEKIAILADSGCVADWEDRFPILLKDVHAKHSPDLYIVIGDVGLSGRPKYYRKVIKYIEETGAFWLAVPGNHDRPLIVFRNFFGAAHKTADIGRWRFIGMNTANKKFTRREARWLVRKIKDNTIIFSHMPPSLEGWDFYSLPEKESARFLNIIDKNRKKIKAVFFGHIHGLSEKKHKGIPMIITGGAAHSKIIENNKYNKDTALEMVIFDVETGEIRIHELEQNNF